jgi:tRNA threonylcarbamoyladenosine biosynthesis protein TsaE
MIALSDEAAALALGARLAAVLRAGDAVTLSGPLGAGKTTIARGLLAALGLEGEAPSPSYAIVQSYQPPEVRLPVMHVDLYRIEDEGELLELGLDDARYDGALVVEWPERVGAHVFPDALRLTLIVAEDGSRGLTADVPAAWEARWPLT